MDHRERDALDRHITGNYGEDQLRDSVGDDLVQDGAEPEDAPEVAFPDVHVQLSETDGNVFAVIGSVSKALWRAGHSTEADAFAREAMNQPTYDAVLQLVMRTVETS